MNSLFPDIEKDPEMFCRFHAGRPLSTPAAVYLLAAMYEFGIGVERNMKVAADHYAVAASRGVAAAHFRIAQFYREGRTLPLDDEEMIHWYRSGAERGHLESQFELGCVLADERRISQHVDEAIVWLRRAASAGHTDAIVKLGELFEYGSGVAKDFVAAHALYSFATNLGNASNDFYHLDGQMSQEQLQEAAELCTEMRGDLIKSLDFYLSLRTW